MLRALKLLCKPLIVAAAMVLASAAASVPAHATTIYWSLFNIEGENAASAVYITYATLDDMLNDTNRTGTGVPDGFGAGVNVVGSGSDGTTYWSLFNIEGENAASAVYITYATLDDMLNDTNRTGTGVPDGFGAGVNVVGTGAFVMLPVKVPEPATLFLLGSGLLGLWGARKKFKK